MRAIRAVIAPECYYRAMPRPLSPPIAADIIAEIGDRVVLIERKNFPPGFAIPGGFVDFGETVEQAAVREAREEISLEVKIRTLLGIYSRPDRDPRGQTITAVYVARASGTPVAADDAQAVGLYDPRKPPAPLAFDHAEILRDYVRFLETGELPAPWMQKK
jgi:8-oxo-dGTP diphosphatase